MSFVELLTEARSRVMAVLVAVLPVAAIGQEAAQRGRLSDILRVAWLPAVLAFCIAVGLGVWLANPSVAPSSLARAVSLDKLTGSA